MRACTFTLNFTTSRAPEFVDITDRVTGFLQESGVQNGMALVFSRHTTGAIKINEQEPLLLQDMEELLERLAPRKGNYRHNDFSIRTVNMTEDEGPNGHAHCQQLILGASETIPVVDGRLQLGQWQSIFFVELDRPRPREVLVQLLGV
jgi:secondary thiamine-phosphate synthase enzyme